MTNKPLKIILGLVFLLILAGVAYWHFFLRGSRVGTTPESSNNGTGGFVPFGRNTTNTGGGQVNTGGGGNNNNTNGTSTIPGTRLKIPTLRLLSNTPVGGYGASTTLVRVIQVIQGDINSAIGSVGTSSASSSASSSKSSKPKTVPVKTIPTTVVRWVDRGRGNIYEAHGDNLDVNTISNTVVPKIYESSWNKNLTAFIALTMPDNSSEPSGVYAELKARILPKVATSTTSSLTNQSSASNYELKGKSLPEHIIAYAVSPKKDRIFLFVNESGTGIGYTAGFNGGSVTQLFTTPITQVNVEWPTDNTIAITTKGSASERGYLYFVDAKTGVWKKILGPLPGLSTKVSTDAKYVLASVTGNSDNVLTSIYNVSAKKGTDAVIRTLADKCVWGNFYKEMVYCGVPSEQIKATYPDDWYKGIISFIDKIWQVNATTGEIHLVSSIVDTSDRVIDAFNLGLDERDDFLFFMNKNDLSLWSLDLVSGN